MDSTEPKQFFLKWNNFENNLATGFASLLEQEAMVDVTLAAEGKVIQAHKIILSICSSYFRNIFQVNPCSHPVVVLKDVGYQELIDMLDFMYKGEANVKQENLPSFLKLAETLKVKGLVGNTAETNSNVMQRNSPSQLLNLTKNLVSNKVNWAEDIKEDISFRKKRKRPSSPCENLDSQSIISSQNIKLGEKKIDNDFIITNSENDVTIKEERLSENSLELQEDNNFLVEDEQNSGPSSFNSFDTVSPVQALETTKYKFIETRFGGHLLVLNGHCYRRRSKCNRSSYWFCCNTKCKAKGILQANGAFKLNKITHNHQPDFNGIVKRETRLQLKKLALGSNVSGQDLLKILSITEDTEKHLRFISTWRCRNRRKQKSDL